MLALTGIAIFRHEVLYCAAAGAIGLGAQFAAARAWRTRSGALAVANLLTFLRLVVVVCLPFLLGLLPSPFFTALVIGLLVIDGIDGRVARARGEASAFGAMFDMETDALTVMVLGILLWTSGSVGAWVLTAGLWRYAYAFAVTLFPALGDCPPSPIYRWIFCVVLTALAGAFLPWTPLARALAALGTALVSFSFAHSIVRSRAFHPTEEDRS
jgi:phosphatidylglycerophosphate synthase